MEGKRMRRIIAIIAGIITIGAYTAIGIAASNVPANATQFDPNQPHSLMQIADHSHDEYGQQKAASPPSASIWYATYITAYSGGNGCMGYNSDSRLVAIQSATCSGNTDDIHWQVRDLNGNGWTVGDELEFVDQFKSFAIGYSGGQFKLETPSLPSTELIFYADNSTYQWQSWILGWFNGSQYIFPKPAANDTPLNQGTSYSYPADGWFPCAHAAGQCAGPIPDPAFG